MFKQIGISGMLLAGLSLLTTSNAAENLTADSAGSVTAVSISHLAEITSGAGVAELQVQTGQTLTNSVVNVAEGKTDITATPLILSFLLKKGRGPFSKLGAEKGAILAEQLRALYPYNLGVYTLFGFKSSGIKGYDQLNGKTIYNGPPRGGALLTARQVLQLVGGVKEGTDYKGIQVNWGQASKTIVDGTADINILPLTLPSQRITVALGAGKMNIISIPKNIWESEKLKKYVTLPGNAPLTIPISDMGYGDGVEIISGDGNFRGIVATGAETVNKNMSNELAKALTAVYIKNMDALMKKTPWAKNIGVGVLDEKKTGFCGLVGMKYHPGAIEAWEEAGHKVPECAKP